MAYGPQIDDGTSTGIEDPATKARRARLKFQMDQQEYLRQKHQGIAPAQGSAGYADRMNELAGLRSEYRGYEAAGQTGASPQYRADQLALAGDYNDKRVKAENFNRQLTEAGRGSDLALAGYDEQAIAEQIRARRTANAAGEQKNTRDAALLPADLRYRLAQGGDLESKTGLAKEQTRGLALTNNDLADPVLQQARHDVLAAQLKYRTQNPATPQEQSALIDLEDKKMQSGLNRQFYDAMYQSGSPGGLATNPMQVQVLAQRRDAAMNKVGLTPEHMKNVEAAKAGLRGEFEPGKNGMFKGGVNDGGDVNNYSMVIENHAKMLEELAKLDPEYAQQLMNDLTESVGGPQPDTGTYGTAQSNAGVAANWLGPIAAGAAGGAVAGAPFAGVGALPGALVGGVVGGVGALAHNALGKPIAYGKNPAADRMNNVLEIRKRIANMTGRNQYAQSPAKPDISMRQRVMAQQQFGSR